MTQQGRGGKKTNASSCAWGDWAFPDYRRETARKIWPRLVLGNCCICSVYEICWFMTRKEEGQLNRYSHKKGNINNKRNSQHIFWQWGMTICTWQHVMGSWENGENWQGEGTQECCSDWRPAFSVLSDTLEIICITLTVNLSTFHLSTFISPALGLMKLIFDLVCRNLFAAFRLGILPCSPFLPASLAELSLT